MNTKTLPDQPRRNIRPQHAERVAAYCHTHADAPSTSSTASFDDLNSRFASLPYDSVLPDRTG
ncbi:MAG: hypothetical protein ACI8TP_005167 [Acidimicrobiales bacterium]|jgi:hypothetical protein